MLIKKSRFYIVTYIIGYLISISSTGIPNVLYIVPIKVFALCIMLVAGNAIYYVAEEKLTIFESGFRTIKYCIISVILLLIFAYINTLLADYGIDLNPFIGI